MKTTHLTILLAISFVQGYSQTANDKYLPEIKAGTLFQYEFKGKDGAELIVDGAILSTEKGALSFVDTLKFGGKMQINKTVISNKAMENANKMRSPGEQPTSAQDGNALFILTDDKTDHCFSRHFLKTLKEQKSATYGGITYNLMPMPAGEVFKFDDRVADAVYMVSANGQKKFWILNNPLYPFILRSASENVNAILKGISNK
jgi:hypothetical protein